jgi:hypothetical protein
LAVEVNYGATLVISNKATILTLIGPNPMEPAQAITITRCYCCNSFGQKASKCATLERQGHSYMERVSTCGLSIRQNGSHDRMAICWGSQSSLGRAVVGNIKTILLATVENTSTNDDGEDAAVQQEVGDMKH